MHNGNVSTLNLCIVFDNGTKAPITYVTVDYMNIMCLIVLCYNKLGCDSFCLEEKQNTFAYLGLVVLSVLRVYVLSASGDTSV